MLNASQELPSVVSHEVLRIARDAGRPVHSVSPGDTLTSDLQFSSLMIARLVIELQERTELDPFMEGYSMADISTLGDLVAAYLATASRTKAA